MAKNKFQIGEIVVVNDKNGESLYAGIVKDWDYNVCTYEIEYEVDYYNVQKERAFTLIGVPEERINTLTLPDNQKDLFEELIQGSKKYSKLSIENNGKWVSAGYAGGKNQPDELYCYCGEGNGYQGADVTPAGIIAKVFDTLEEANTTKGYTVWNGHGEKITLEPMEAYSYFNKLQASIYNTALMFLNLNIVIGLTIQRN